MRDYVRGVPIVQKMVAGLAIRSRKDNVSEFSTVRCFKSLNSHLLVILPKSKILTENHINDDTMKKIA